MATRASAKDFQLRLSMSSHSWLAKKLSAMTLAHALPTLPIDGRAPISLQRLPKSTPVVWLATLVRMVDHALRLVHDERHVQR